MLNGANALFWQEKNFQWIMKTRETRPLDFIDFMKEGVERKIYIIFFILIIKKSS